MQSKSSDRGMVVAKVIGGLGNQLFIYAAAKRLSVMNNVPLKLDVISGYIAYEYDHIYSLDHFQINAAKATERETHELNLGKRRNIGYHINKVLPFGYKRYIKEEKLFDPRLLTLRVVNEIYLDGYWQNEIYFKDIESVIRHDLEIVTPHDPENIVLAEEISAANSVCLHARRIKYEHLLSARYYELAIQHMASKVRNPHFFCFADDMEWVRRNLPMDWPITYITHNPRSKDYEDLWLMKRCKHFIIANSTFSWWGAWLNADPDKIVIAPRDWGYRAAVPKEWVVL